MQTKNVDDLAQLDLLEKGQTKKPYGLAPLDLLEKGQTKKPYGLAPLDLLEKGQTKKPYGLAQPFSKVDFLKVEKVDTLPCELVMMIKSFLPKTSLIFLNRYYYKKYHYLVKKMVNKNNFENYLRDIVRRDNEFVFSQILLDFHKNLSRIKNYVYKNIMYKNYFYFLTDYCIKNSSINCRNVLNEFLKVQGLCQNRHKKNTFIHIRWKH